MSSLHRPKGGFAAILAVGRLVALPVLYVASAGPALRLSADDYGYPNGDVARLYKPISWAAGKWRPARKAQSWYIDAWGAGRVLE